MVKLSQSNTVPGPGQGLRNAFAPAAIEFTGRAVDLGEYWARAYVVTDYPPAVDAGWLAGAANLEGVALAVHLLPTDPAKLTLAISRSISIMAGQMENGGSPLTLQRLERKIGDGQAMLRKIDQEQQTVFTVGVIALVTAPDEAVGLRRSKRLEGVLAAAGMRAMVAASRQEDGLRAAGPWGLFPESLRGGAPLQLPAETVAAAFPFSSGGINHGSGIIIGHDSSRGLVLVNRWHPPADSGITNPNWTVLAGPGAGKSHGIKLMLHREWVQGTKIVVIDPEREYKHLCRELDGAWVNAGGGGARVNLFQAPPLPREADDGEEAETDIGLSAVGQHLQRVRMILSLYLPGLTQMQRALLSRALRAVYEQAGITMDTDPATIPNQDWPHIGHLYAYTKTQESDDWRVLEALLEEAAIGADAALWAGPSAPVPDSDFIVIDIHDLENADENLQRAQFANVLGFAWDIVRRDRSERILLVVDEAWMLVDPNVPQALSFLKRMAKRIRKYSGSLNVITQNAGDFLAPEVAREGEPVLANASTKFLLRQDAKDLPTVTALYNLSEAEQDKLRSARIGEGLLIAGNQRAWVTIDTAPYETELLYG